MAWDTNVKKTGSMKRKTWAKTTRNNEGHQGRERRRWPENRIVVHKRVISKINTIIGGSVEGRESSSARKNHARRLLSGEVLSAARPSKSQKRESQPITFIDEDLYGVTFPYDEALVVTLFISNYNIHKVFIDTGSSMDILFISPFQRMTTTHGCPASRIERKKGTTGRSDCATSHYRI